MRLRSSRSPSIDELSSVIAQAARERVRRAAVCLQEVLRRGGQARRRQLGAAQLGQQIAAQPGRRWLGQRAFEQHHGRRSAAALLRMHGRLAQLADDLRVAARSGVQELQRDPLGAGSSRAQQLGGRRVRDRQLGLRQRRPDRAGEDRVAKAQLRGVGKHPGSHELAGGGRTVCDGQPGQLRGEVQRAAVPEHRGRTGERGRLRTQPRERPRNGVGDRRRRDGVDALDGDGLERHAVAQQRVRQLLDEERVAAGRGVTGARELLVDRVAADLPQPARDALRPQRRGLETAAPDVRADLRQRRSPAAARILVAPRADHDRDPQRVDAAGEVGEEAQRRLVGPVRVVDDERDRRLVGEVRDEPVEPVQQPRRRHVDALGHADQDRLGEPRGSLQQPLALGVTAYDRPQAHPHDPERILALELGPARVHDPHPALGGIRAAGIDERGLADPGGPLDQQHRPLPARAPSSAATIPASSASRSTSPLASPFPDGRPGTTPH